MFSLFASKNTLYNSHKISHILPRVAFSSFLYVFNNTTTWGQAYAFGIFHKTQNSACTQKNPNAYLWSSIEFNHKWKIYLTLYCIFNYVPLFPTRLLGFFPASIYSVRYMRALKKNTCGREERKEIRKQRHIKRQKRKAGGREGTKRDR